MKLKVTGLFLAAAMLLSGCVSAEGYRQHMSLNVGKTGDQLQVEWGIPSDRSVLSDGSELWVYHRTSESRSGGYWTERQSSRTEEFVDKDGKKRTRTVTYKEPYYEPEVVSISYCETRFVVGADNVVKSVSFEGGGCLAEEIEDKTA